MPKILINNNSTIKFGDFIRRYSTAETKFWVERWRKSVRCSRYKTHFQLMSSQWSRKTKRFDVVGWFFSIIILVEFYAVASVIMWMPMCEEKLTDYPLIVWINILIGTEKWNCAVSLFFSRHLRAATIYTTCNECTRAIYPTECEWNHSIGCWLIYRSVTMKMLHRFFVVLHLAYIIIVHVYHRLWFIDYMNAKSYMHSNCFISIDFEAISIFGYGVEW